MRPDDSPFETGWWGSGLEEVGLKEVRPRVSTYGRYDYDLLPLFPFPSDGEMTWLREGAPHEGNIAREKSQENVLALEQLRRQAAARRAHLPESFLFFLEAKDLKQRVRSNTDCSLDLCPDLVQCPGAPGRLVRFLSDSQYIRFWYLYVADGLGHAVVSSRTFYGTPEEEWEEQERDPSEIVFVADSFAAFLWRFWIENEIWFAAYYDKTPITPAGQAYLAEYTSRARARAQHLSGPRMSSSDTSVLRPPGRRRW